MSLSIYYFKGYIVNCYTNIMNLEYSGCFLLIIIYKCTSLHSPLIIFRADFWSLCSFWYILIDLPSACSSIMTCFSVTFSFIKVTWKKMIVFLLFHRHILNQEMYCFGFYGIKSKTKALFWKKERLCDPAEQSWLGLTRMLSSSCLALCYWSHYVVELWGERRRRRLWLIGWRE